MSADPGRPTRRTLITAAADAWIAGVEDANASTYAVGMIGNSAGQGSFGGADMLSDVDAMTVGLALRSGSATKISTAIGRRYATVAAAKATYREFVTARFGSRATMLTAANNLFTQISDLPLDGARAALWQKSVGLDTPYGTAVNGHGPFFAGIAQAFVDVVHTNYIA